MRQRLVRLVDQLRSSFWFLPAVLLAAAALLAWLALQVDAAYDGTVGGLLYNGGPDGARTLLGTIAGSMVTVGTTVFSITMVALTLASNQFGPRMLTNFLRDRGNQLTIGLFLAVFLYSLLVLRAVRDQEDRVPDVSVSLAIVLAVTALMVLIYFIHHIASSIQVMNLLQLLGDDLQAGLDSTLPDVGEQAPVAATRHEVFGAGRAVAAHGSGYVQYIDHQSLLRLAARRDLVVSLLVRPGRFVVEGTPLARAWSAEGRAAAAADVTDLGELVSLGPRRSVVQDVEFPVRQLVEVGVRALSPGINDPITASASINQLSVGLCRVADRPMPPAELIDSDGVARLVHQDPLTWERLVGGAFNQLRQAAGEHVVVHLHLLDALATIAGCTDRPDRWAVLRRHGELVWERAQQAVAQQADLEVVRERYDALLDALGQA